MTYIESYIQCDNKKCKAKINAKKGAYFPDPEEPKSLEWISINRWEKREGLNVNVKYDFCSPDCVIAFLETPRSQK